MDKGKVIPISITCVLLAIGTYLVVNFIQNSKVYEKLIVSYKDYKTEYKDIKVDNVIVVNNISFWIVSTNKNEIVISSSEYLLADNKENNRFKIKLDETKKICLASGDCIYFNLE